MGQVAHQEAVLWTTSRYASPETKKKAQSLAGRAGSRYLARGKKTMDDIAGFARRSGFGLIMLLEESDGHPSLIRSIGISPDGRWRWAGVLKVENYEGRQKDEKYES